MNRTGSIRNGGFAALVCALLVMLSLVNPAASAWAAPPFMIASNAASQSFSFDGTNYLFGIESHATSPPSIGAQMMSSAGTPVGGAISTGRTGITSNVEFDGSNYLLIWEDDGLNTSSGSTGWQVYGQFISTAGTVVGTPFAISSMGIWFDGVKVMAFGGGSYLVTYTKLIVPANGAASNNRYIAGRIVNTDGSMGSEFRISSGFGAASDVAFDGSNFFVVWREDSLDREIRGRFVSPTGVPGTEISVNASSANSDNPKSVTFDGSNYLVVWNDEVGGAGTGTWDVFGQLVSPAGALMGGVITITNEPGPQVVTSVAFDGSNYLAVWMDMSNDVNGNGNCDVTEGTCWDMYGQYIRKTGSLKGGKIAISTEPTNQMGGVGYVNGRYLALINNDVVMGPGGLSQVGAAFGSFIVPTAEAGLSVPGSTGKAAQSAAFDGTNYLVGIENLQAATPTIGAQLMAANGTPVGSYIPTGRSGIAANVAFDGTNYLLVWEDDGLGTLSGTTGWQMYGQRISKSGATVGSPFAITTAGIWDDGVKILAFGGGKYLVTYTRLINPANGTNSGNRYIAGRIVNPDGSLLGSEFRISTGFGFSSDVSYDGTNFFVVWCDDAGSIIRGRFVSTAGVPGTEITVNASPAPSDNPKSVTFDGSNYLVVWNDLIDTSGPQIWDVFGQMVSPSGALVGGVITINNDPGPQIVTSVAFDGSNYLAVLIDMTNDANHNQTCDTGEGTCWDLYGQFINKNGLLLGSKITISTDPSNQIGGVGFANGRYAVLVNNGIVMSPAGGGAISQVTDASAVFITPAVQHTASGPYTYTGGAAGGPLTLTWTDSQFICSGPQLGTELQTVSSLTATTMVWADGMTWTRVGSGVDGDIRGTWISADPGSNNTFIVTFDDTTISVIGQIFTCGSDGPPGIAGFSPASGPIGSLVSISGNNFSPLASSNSILFNGAPATVTGVRSGQLFAVVPPGATSGFITVTNSNGTATTSIPFTVTATPTGTSLSGGGVSHRLDSAGSQFDALEAVINSYATSLAGMTLTVSGPSGFSYTFADADIVPHLNGQLKVVRKYPTPTTPLAAGIYTFTLNDGQGHISHRVDRHVTAPAPLQVDSTKIQLQRLSGTGNDQYRVSWAPLNDTQTYYYRVRISYNTPTDTPVYETAWDMKAQVNLPAGILFDGSIYKLRVEAGDGPGGDIATRRSDSGWKVFLPQTGDYNPNQLMTGFAVVNNLSDLGSSTLRFQALLNVSDPTKVTSITLTGPNGFNDTTLISSKSIRTNDGTTPITDFFMNYTAAAAMTPGLYTFTYATALGGTQTAYANLTSPVAYPAVDFTTMRKQNLGDGNIRFSWAGVNNVGALYYRVVLNNQNSNVSYPTTRVNRAFADVPASIITAMGATRWRVEVYDSDDTTTQRNRVNTAWVDLGSIPAFDPAQPVINSFRVRNTVNAAGVAYSQVMVDAAGPQGTLSSITVQGPAPSNSYTRDLLSVGRYSPQYGGYLLEEAGTLLPGLYTITVTNAAGSAARSMYVPAASALPQPDYHYFYNDLEPNGDMRISWAPVAANVPVWYAFRLFGRDDLDGDGLLNLLYTQSVNNSVTFQTNSVTVPAAVVAQWTMPAMIQVSASDGLNSSVINNSSLSRMVGAQAPGINSYATLVDVDVDGYTNDIDPNDANAALYPFSAGNDGLATAVAGTSPLNGAVGVPPVGASINAAFNKVIDQRTLTTTSFTLTAGAGGVAGTVTYNPASRTATFTPSAALQSGTTYTATLTTAVRDQAGAALSASSVWSFTTAGSVNSAYSSGGTYSYDPSTGTFTMNTTFTNFPCDGPEMGSSNETVLSLTATGMTWQGMTLSWTRLNGVAGDITGVWRATDPATGTAYTLVINTNGTFSVTAGMFMCGPATPQLSVTIAGGGNVNSTTGTPGIHGTVPGVYSSSYPWIAPVVLNATAHAGWDFSAWSGDCTPSLLSCTLTIDAPLKNVTATFTVQPNIRVGTSLNYYGTLQEAFDGVADGAELRLQRPPLTFTETPVYNRPAVGITPAASVTLKGGWDSGFTSNAQPNTTVIIGSLKVQAGRVNVQQITVRKQ